MTVKPERCSQPKNKLYPIEVVKKEGNRVKIHYVGYSDYHDEWRDTTDIVPLVPRPGDVRQMEYKPFDPHAELLFQIKQALDSSTRKDPDVRIEILLWGVQY